MFYLQIYFIILLLKSQYLNKNLNLNFLISSDYENIIQILITNSPKSGVLLYLT